MIGSKVDHFKVTVTQNLVNFLQDGVALSNQVEDHTIVEQLGIPAELQNYAAEGTRPVTSMGLTMRDILSLRVFGEYVQLNRGRLYNVPHVGYRVNGSLLTADVNYRLVVGTISSEE
ncbi:hypothetical protein Clacol_002283 [Clathrus columnatus]|uniref:Uncharacterized protein n=1 Tax=Clathrus columnatus TaxID=1419009 RepID=A0AAV5A680_9AGAM|nr:hypothetical protein Clacol_002283 [Clathrus columnatus]